MSKHCRHRVVRALVAVVGALAWAGVAATAHSVTFDFNNVTPNSNKTTDVNNVQNYMNGVFAGSNTVTLNRGTKSKRVKPDSSHPTSGYPYLGNTDGAPSWNSSIATFASKNGSSQDTYLINDWNNNSLTAADKRDRIVMTFSNPISSVAFDWEIFPQTQAGADIDVFAIGTGFSVNIFSKVLPFCSTNCLTTPPTPNVRTGDLGHFNTYYFDSAHGWNNGPVTQLQFVDWTTAPVGIDNLEVGAVPEPASVLLLGFGFAGLAAWRRMKKN